MIFLNLFLINLLSTSAENNHYEKTSLIHEGSDSQCDTSAGYCLSKEESENMLNKMILYDVNPSEGFNLRRDVYLRFALMLADARLKGKTEWNLVLPPWNKLYHWKTTSPDSEPIFWGEFFDLKSLKAYPVLEMYEAFEKNNNKPIEIDTLYILQNFENPFENGVFEEKWQLTGDCEYNGNYFGYKNITAKEIICVKFQGKIAKLWELILLHPNDRIVMFMHGEIPLHDMYGSKSYWDCRKSMKFNTQLIAAAKRFIDKKLEHKYLSVHWRRGDFAHSRPDDVPSIEGTAKQIHEAAKKEKLKHIFIATDASHSELKELKKKLKGMDYKVHTYEPAESDLKQFKDSGVAIIDQIICSYASYFIGTHDSTFSFRIQEEREILGHKSHTTFNRLCPDSGTCEKPSMWRIVQ